MVYRYATLQDYCASITKNGTLGIENKVFSLNECAVQVLGGHPLLMRFDQLLSEDHLTQSVPSQQYSFSMLVLSVLSEVLYMYNVSVLEY